MQRAQAFLFPFLEDKTRWPFAKDVEHFDALPVRSPSLLFCGLGCRKEEYIALWRRLNPDPQRCGDYSELSDSAASALGLAAGWAALEALSL